MLSVFLLAACSAPLSQTSALATAQVGGCWPYTVPQPQPSATPRDAAGATTTATPLATTNPLATTTPFAGPWPLCTPEPQVPTHTPTLTPVRTAIPPLTPQPIGSAPPASGNIQEVADQPGVSTNVTAVVNPTTRQIAVAWISWGWSADESTDGQVWVRVQDRSLNWQDAQTVNGVPVNKGGGGVGISWLSDGTLVSVWAETARSPMQMTVSTDSGATWDAPASIGAEGGVTQLLADSADGLHLLFRAVNGVDDNYARYGYRDPVGSWSFSDRLPDSRLHAALGILDHGDGAITRIVGLADSADSARALRSTDGQTWDSIPLDTHRFMNEETRQDVSVVTAIRPDGDLVAIAWGQYSAEGVFATVSTDGGLTFGPEERIAQYPAPQNETGRREGCCGYGWSPSLAYEPASQTLVAVWLQRDFLPDDAPDQASHGAWQVMLSYRPLDPARRHNADTWEQGVAPDTTDPLHVPTTLTDRGWTGLIVPDLQHRTPVLLTIDGRNRQWRIYVRAVTLTGYVVQGES